MDTKRFKLVPAAYLFLVKNNKILLQRRCNTGFEDGNYGLVSGHVDGNETFRQALARETKEEIGINLRASDLEVVHMMHRIEKSNPPEIRERVDVFLKAKKWRGAIKNMEPHKCDDLKWFSFDDLPDNIIVYVKFAIKNIRDKIFYSEFGW